MPVLSPVIFICKKCKRFANSYSDFNQREKPFPPPGWEESVGHNSEYDCLCPVCVAEQSAGKPLRREIQSPLSSFLMCICNRCGIMGIGHIEYGGAAMNFAIPDGWKLEQSIISTVKAHHLVCSKCIRSTSVQ